jgi:tRNA(Ile)-lysidine synthase
MLVAVSGGLDSVVLFHLCLARALESGTRMEVAHVDHGLREVSSVDANFVRELCAKAGVPFHLFEAPEKPSNENTEAWGRRIRYDFFNELLEVRELDFVATAHHADDVCETFLMRMVSNKEPGEILRFDPRRKVVRPLLNSTREQILAFAEENKIAWREDETNTDETFLRNKIRHSLMPMLREKFDPRISEVLAIRAQALAEDSAALEAWSHGEAQRLHDLSFGSRDWFQAVKAVMAALEPALQWRFARDILAEEIGFPLSRARATEVVDFVLNEKVGVELPSGIQLRRKDGGIIAVRPC